MKAPCNRQAGVVRFGLPVVVILLLGSGLSPSLRRLPRFALEFIRNSVVEHASTRTVCPRTIASPGAELGQVISKIIAIKDVAVDSEITSPRFQIVLLALHQRPGFKVFSSRQRRLDAAFFRREQDRNVCNGVESASEERRLIAGYYFNSALDPDTDCWQVPGVSKFNRHDKRSDGFLNVNWKLRNSGDMQPSTLRRLKGDGGNFSGFSRRIGAPSNIDKGNDSGDGTNNHEQNPDRLNRQSPLVYGPFLLVLGGPLLIGGYIGIYRGLRNMHVKMLLVGMGLAICGAVPLLFWIVWLVDSSQSGR